MTDSPRPAWMPGHPAGMLLSALALPGLLWLGNPALGLLVGGAIALGFNRCPFVNGSRMAAYSLQTAIVLLGLNLDLNTLWSLSAQYTGAVAVYVLATMGLGLMLGRLLGVEAASSKLVSAGTAICGGTAIATLSGLVRAQPQQIGVALAIVFLLNAVALITFPWVGRYLELSQLQFGLWSALAIHDTSSVVATAAIYGERAAEVATTLKLGRTLWLIPLVLAVSVYEQRVQQREGPAGPTPRLRVPGFILAFVAAAGVGSAVDLPDLVAAWSGQLSRWLLVVALFLVGTELTRTTVRQIRGRVLWQALGLWLAVVPVVLAAVVWLV
jgi:uncharacterized integral membrane protein (TIGR00698 family)